MRRSTPRTKDIMGLRFERLTVIGRAPKLPTSAFARWLCRCDCGNETVVRGQHLRSGDVRSCGCLIQSESRTEHCRRLGKSLMTHGESIYGQRTPEYCAWVEMIKRCTATSGKHWMKYGGRGIVVCDRWRHSYETFLADMGRKPSPRHSLDRRDNDGIYEPSNCRWATSLEQNNNRRNNIRITYKKKLITASEASAISGIPYKTMVKRILSGWSPEDAMERPLRRW